MTSDKFVIAEGLLGSIVLYCTPIGDGEYAEAKDFGKVLAIELLKCAALGLGMEAGMAAWHAIWDKLVGSEEDTFKRKMTPATAPTRSCSPS